MSNILMLLKTNGLAYDDRVKKECLSLNKLGLSTTIAVLENENNYRSGTTYSSDTEFLAFKLVSRKVFPSNKFLILKLLEWFVRLMPMLIRKRDIIWLHDPILFVFLPFIYVLKKLGRVNKIVWDLHELPPDYFLSNFLLSRVFKYMLFIPDNVIHANEERAKYLNGFFDISLDYHVLRNFVSDEFSSSIPERLPVNLLDWLSGEEYIFVQSGLYRERCFDTVAEAVTKYIHKKCVVVGGFNDSYLSEIKKKYDNFDDYFYLTGMINQEEIVDYLVPSAISLILYHPKSKNSELCEPNRLYYSIEKKVPVLVGANPTMAKIVLENNCGLVLEDCGYSAEILSKNLDYFFNSDVNYEFNFECKWESQMNVIKELVS